MKIVVVTPAGRRDRMSVLAAHVLADPSVDRWDCWENTRVAADLAYLRELEAHPKVRVVRLPDPYDEHPVAFRIHRFFPHATDPDAVYVRLDDDIVWYEPGAVAELARRRVADPHPFLISGNVLNSGLTSYRHQQRGRVDTDLGLCADVCMDAVAWATGAFAVRLHQAFLARPWPELWRLDDFSLDDYRRHSINAVAWLGADAAHWSRSVDKDEEVWLAQTEPARTGRPLLVCGPPLFAHLSFYTQHAAVEAAGILEAYRRLCP